MPTTSSPQSIHQSKSLLDAFYRFTDAASIVSAGLCAALLTTHDWRPLFLPASISIIVFFIVAEFTGLYRNWRGVATEREVVCACLTWGASVLLLLVAGFLARHTQEYPRSQLLAWTLSVPVYLGIIRTSIRIAQKTMRARGMNTRGFGIVGINDLGIRLARNIENSPQLGLRLIGFYDDRPDARTPDLPAAVGEKVGDLTELIAKARAGEVDCIYITFPMRAEDRIRNVLNRLGDTTASVHVVPDFFVFELLHSRWSNIGGLPVVSVFENPFYGVDGVIKRAADLVLASTILLMLSLPMMIIAALVKFTSAGPVFFRQKRYGLDGREIRVWKFRSMTVCEDGAKVVQAQKNDSRITWLGGILRRTSLDELPQLFNVIDGSMSLVGPRPHATAHNEEFRTMIQGYMLRHKVKPGITGLAQVSGWRGETDTLEKMEKRIECDHQYIRNWSLWMDVKILLKTVIVVFKRQNAY